MCNMQGDKIRLNGLEIPTHKPNDKFIFGVFCTILLMCISVMAFGSDWAEVKDGKVVRVFTGNTKEFYEQVCGGTWVEYNGDETKNRPGIGFEYLDVKKNFAPPNPYPSWVLNEKCIYEAPIGAPAPKAGKISVWDEPTQSWKEKDVLTGEIK